ncbi:hypothetical protein PanWU01x14_215520, partial [Parasponia andersonii]
SSIWHPGATLGHHKQRLSTPVPIFPGGGYPKKKKLILVWHYHHHHRQLYVTTWPTTASWRPTKWPSI